MTRGYRWRRWVESRSVLLLSVAGFSVDARNVQFVMMVELPLLAFCRRTFLAANELVPVGCERGLSPSRLR